MFAKTSAAIRKLYNRIAYPAPKSLDDIIAKALHEATDENIRRKAKEARRIVKYVPQQLKMHQLDRDDTFSLCSIDIEHDLTPEAYEALAWYAEIPRSIDAFEPTSTPYLVAHALINAGQRVMINAFRYGESRFLGFKISADDEDSIRLELRFIASERNY